MVTDLLAPVFGHHSGVHLVILPTGVEMVELELERALPCGNGLEYFNACRDNLGADAIIGNCGNTISASGHSFMSVMCGIINACGVCMRHAIQSALAVSVGSAKNTTIR